MTGTLERWRDPVFNNLYEQVPEQLAARLTEMAEELTLTRRSPRPSPTVRSRVRAATCLSYLSA
jgi:hypothetical protein